MRLDDEEARARLAAAEAEAGLRKRQRDAEPSTSGREDVTKGEDNVYSAEREVIGARFELDAALAGKRRGEATDRTAGRCPPPPGESAGARRARAPQLRPGAGQGEPAVAEPVRIGADRRARQRGARRLAARQDAHPHARAPATCCSSTPRRVRSWRRRPSSRWSSSATCRTCASRPRSTTATSPRSRSGRRHSCARSTIRAATSKAPSPIWRRPWRRRASSARGPRRPSDIEVLEMTINLDGKVPLLPGMRVDAFVRPDR